MAVYDYQLLLKHILEFGVDWSPDQEVVFRDRFQSTYEEMYHRVLSLASALQELGVNKGTRVGVIEWDSHRYLEMYFAVPGIGAVLHTINPNLSPENVVYSVEHAEDQVLIFNEDFLQLVEQIRSRVPSIKKFVSISETERTAVIPWIDGDYEVLVNSSPRLDELPDFDEKTQATLAYTTGTTGRPKGVHFSHRQLVLQTYAGWGSFATLGNYGGLGKHEVYMPLTPMFHVHAWGFPYVATTFGWKQIYNGRYDPEIAIEMYEKHKVTFSHCVPTILQMILTHPNAENVDFNGWKVIIGGARLTKGLAIEAEKRGIKVTTAYGLSETCPLLVLGNLKPSMEKEWQEDRLLDQRLRTGVSMPLVKTRVVAPDGEDVTWNGEETGEIVVRAPWLTPSYYKDSERTKELWTGGWMHTGDVANVDEYGYLQIVDRIKDVIKSGGEWIVSLELENLLSMHEDVLEAGVIGVPDEKWGERPLAVIVPVEGASERINQDDLNLFLHQYVENGTITKWAVPDSYIFVEDLPRTSVGKIDKKALRERYSTPTM
ncbi:MAG: long-chain-fatty-acid--CoA ligase [Anaerolineales bacterium]|nr:long-chain-fatty-acid--CoA ligase [Anaerolineales bacterium]